jgi:tetratricopeptide (TPR) repeat protein
VRRAQDLRLVGRYQESLDQCQLILANVPDHVATLLTAARATKQLLRFEESFGYAQRLLAEQPGSNDASLLVADLAEQLGRFDVALAEAEKVLGREPTQPQALAMKERIAERTGAPAVAMAMWSSLVDRFPSEPRHRLRREQARMRSGGEQKAYSELVDLSKRFPELAEAGLQAGHAARWLGQRGEALQRFNDAAAVLNERAILLDIVRELLHLERFVEANARLATLPSSVRGTLEAKLLRLAIAARLDCDAARRFLREALGSERDAAPRAALLRDAADLGFGQEALSALQVPEAALALESPVLQIEIARICLRIGDAEKANEIVERVARESLPPKQLADLLEICAELDDPQRVRALLAELESALPRFPVLPRGQLERAVLLAFEAGESDRGSALLESRGADAGGPSRMFRAVLAAERGDVAGALDLIEAEVSINPETPLDRWRGRVASAGGDLPAARAALQRQLSDSSPVALQDTRLWVRTLIDSEEISRAWGELRRLEAVFPARDLLGERADVLHSDLRLDEELELLRQAVARDPLNENAAVRLVLALIQLEQPVEARKLLDLWAKRRPSSLVWLRRRLLLAAATHHDERDLLKVYDGCRRAATPRGRIELGFDRLQIATRLGLHDEADRLLDAFRADVMRAPFSDQRRNEFQASAAHQLTWLGRRGEARPVFDRLTSDARAPVQLVDEWLRLASVDETFGAGDAHRCAMLRGRISNPRHHLQVAPFHDAAPAGTPPTRVLVLVHLFHPALWPEIRDRLATSLRGTPFRLRVSLGGPSNFDAVLPGLRALDADVQVVRVENRGFDVGGHWQNLERVDLQAFDVVMLLQTKESRHTRVGPVWRRNLMHALMGSAARWRDNLCAFADNQRLGMIASALHQSSFHSWSYPEMQQVLRALGMPLEFDALKAVHRFATGTMFMIRADLLAEMHAKTRRKIEFERYERLSVRKRRDDSYAHAMERAFGMYVLWRGYEILWRP